MPSSRACTIPYVMRLVRTVKPNSILDVGVGFGKWGYLFREYTDIVQSEKDPARYQKNNWRTRIDGIEAFEAYLHPAHKYIYDNIQVGDAATVLPTLGAYDMIFFGDIIEHFDLEQGQQLLLEAGQHAAHCVCVTTPRFATAQGALCNNALEQHRSVWTPSDFRKVNDCSIYLADDKTYVVVYWTCESSRIESQWGVDIQPRLRHNVRRAVRCLSRCLPWKQRP